MNKEKIKPVDYVGAFANPAKLPRTKKHVLFMGRSNSGKSTLLSLLIHNSRLVKTSATPGSTRLLHVYERENVFLTDLPGYGFAKISKKERDTLSDIISGCLQHTDLVTMGMLTIDSRRSLAAEEKYIIELFLEVGRPLNLVYTKLDKLKQSEVQALKKRKHPTNHAFYYSSLKKTGLADIYNTIEAL